MAAAALLGRRLRCALALLVGAAALGACGGGETKTVTKVVTAAPPEAEAGRGYADGEAERGGRRDGAAAAGAREQGAAAEEERDGGAGGRKEPGAAGARSDRAIAKAAVIRADDLRAGWRAERGGDRAPPEGAEPCRVAVRSSGFAESPAYARGTDGFSNFVAVYASEADAARAFAAMASESARACYRDWILAHARERIEHVGGRVTRAAEDELVIDALGDERYAAHVTLYVARGAERDRVHVALVEIRVGRATTGAQLISISGPIEEALVNAVSALAADRLAEALR